MIRKAQLFILLALFLLLLLWTIWENTALTVSTVTVSGNRIPTAFSGFRIAQVSDLHNAEFGEHNAALLQVLRENTPDIIVITGDLVDSRHTGFGIALDFVKEAAKIAPVYYVSGNHEARLAQYDEIKTGLAAAGAVVLEDQAIKLSRSGESITLIGLSDPDFTIKGDLFEEAPAMVRTKLEGLMDGKDSYRILLSHRPELFETYGNCGVDLVFSGHAHGGQFRLPLIGGLFAPNQGFFPKYDGGVYTDGNTTMVVSRGIGNSLFPLRFNNPPEIVITELLQTP